MHLTERAERLDQLRQELQLARKHRAYYDQVASEARDSSYEETAPQARDAWMSHSVRLRAQAVAYGTRVHELVKLIAELEGPAAVLVTDEQCAAVDSTMGALA